MADYITILGVNIRELAPLPCFYLLAHGLEAPLHAADANRDAIDKRDAFGCLARTGVNTVREHIPKINSAALACALHVQTGARFATRLFLGRNCSQAHRKIT